MKANPDRIRQAVLNVEEGGPGVALSLARETEQLASKGGILVYTGEIEGDLERASRRDRDERASEVQKRPLAQGAVGDL
jgi:hypothetical protein